MPLGNIVEIEGEKYLFGNEITQSMISKAMSFAELVSSGFGEHTSEEKMFGVKFSHFKKDGKLLNFKECFFKFLDLKKKSSYIKKVTIVNIND